MDEVHEDTSVPSWECRICFSDQLESGWTCPNEHKFCNHCMRQHVDSVAFPRCPYADCDHELEEPDFRALNVPLQRIEVFQQAKLLVAVDTLAGAGEVLVRCSDGDCPNVVVLMAGAGRQRLECYCGAPPFCTQCGQSPYHYHADCSQVQALREQWLNWNSGGREDYDGKVYVASQSAAQNAANDALKEAVSRHEELEADERWKSRNCRLCPKCSRPINRVEGCPSMVCGRNYHGGELQPGCGHRFNWKKAKPYVANVEHRELTQLSTEQLRLRGRSAFHPFTECQVCGAVGMAGPRFRCLHCPSFDACRSCESSLLTEHQAGHVFEIMFESDFQWSGLPKDTRVRVVRSGDSLPSIRGEEDEADKTRGSQLEGLFGTLRKDLSPAFEGYRVKLEHCAGTFEIAGKYLEPVLTSRQQAEILLAASLDAKDTDDDSDALSDDDSDDEYVYEEGGDSESDIEASEMSE